MVLKNEIKPGSPPNGSGEAFSPHKKISNWNPVELNTRAFGKIPTVSHFEAELLQKIRFSWSTRFLTNIS